MIIALCRTVILYLFIIIVMRILGKRQIGELEPSELVLSLLLADLAAVPMQDFGIPLFSGIIPILALLCLSSVLSALTVKHVRMRALLNGKPSIVIQDGKIITKEMKRNRFTADELLEELRLSGTTDIRKVKCATLETSGRLSVIPYADEQPVTGKLIHIKAEEQGVPLIIINEGRVLTDNLTLRGFDRAWLNKQLKSNKIKHEKDVFLMTVDEKNTIFFTLKSAA